MNRKALSAFLALSIFSAPAFAWGDREQGILAGIAGYWLYQRLNEPRVVVQRTEVYSHPAYGRAAAPPRIAYQPYCRQVITVEVDRYGNEYRAPLTVCE